MARVSIRSRDTTETSITWVVAELQQAAELYSFKIHVTGSGYSRVHSWSSNNSTGNTEHTVSGLSPDTRYTGEVSVSFKGGSWVTWGSASGYTDEPPYIPNPPTSLSIRYYNIRPNEFSYEITSNGATSYRIELDNGLTSTRRQGTFTGLKPSTKYYVDYRAANNDGQIPSSGFKSSNVTTTSQPTFSWTSNITSGQPVAITKTEWDRLCDTISALMALKGVGSYTPPYATRGEPITADQFNKARAGLATITSRNLPSRVSPGDALYASEFKLFETAIANTTV